MARAGQVMTIERALVAVAATLSVTRTVKLNVPAAVGVPVIAPALERDSPVGSDPTVTAQVYGTVPPLAFT